MSEQTLDQAKVELRQRLLTHRRVLARSAPQAGVKLVKHFRTAFADVLRDEGYCGYCVGAYHAIGAEIDPRPIVEYLSGLGITLALPVVIARETALEFRRYTPGDALDREALGTLAPTNDKPVCCPDMLLVPLLGFDAGGYRLGYGGGFYDRTLAGFNKAGHDCRLVGLAYAGQQVERVPCGEFDLPLETILTERGIVWPESPEAHR